MKKLDASRVRDGAAGFMRIVVDLLKATFAVD